MKGKPKPGYTKFAHYLLRSLPRHCKYTELVCLYQVVFWTSMLGREWVDISDDQFVAAARVSRRWVEEAIEWLSHAHGAHWIEWRKGKPRYDHGKLIGHADEYRLRLRFDLDAKRVVKKDPIYAECGVCETAGAMEPDHGYCPVPPLLIRHVPGCVSHAAYLCLLVIMDEQAGYNNERVQISVEDILRDTGLESRRSVQMGLAELQALEYPLIGEEQVPGGASWYWTEPANFGKNKPRKPRQRAPKSTGNPAQPSSGDPEPEASETNANPEPPEPPQPTVNKYRRRATEFVERAICKCRNCGAIGPVLVVASEVGGRSVPVQTPIGGSRGSPPTGPPPKAAPKPENEGLEGEHGELYAWLMTWESLIHEVPSAKITAMIAAALDGAPVGYLERECQLRSRNLPPMYSYGLFVTLAQKVAKRWKADEIARKAASVKRREYQADQPQRGLFDTIEDAEFWLSRADTPLETRAAIIERWPRLKP